MLNRLRQCCLVLALLALPAGASAEPLHLPRVGQQYLSLGASLQPGFLHDRTVPEAPAWSSAAVTGGGTMRVGLHQILSRRLIMSAELDAGVQWLNEHTAQPRGRADSEMAFSWQVALLGRWLPAGEESGWALGFGPHYYGAQLSDRPMQSIGFDLRVGRFIWQADEDFLLLECGYAVPFIQGLSSGNGFRSRSSDDPPADPVGDWTFHRFGLNVEYGF